MLCIPVPTERNILYKLLNFIVLILFSIGSLVVMRYTFLISQSLVCVANYIIVNFNIFSIYLVSLLAKG